MSYLGRPPEFPKLGIVKDDGTLVILQELSADTYKNYQSARKRVHEFVADQSILDIVIRNYDDFKQYVRQQADVQVISTLGTELRTEANRQILNLLSSFRSFLDYSETRLKRRYGKESPQYERYKAVCSDCYDNVFSYRFLYRLRNYIQHCGMPIGSITHRAKLIDAKSNRIQTSLEICFNRNILLEKFSGWGPQVKNELQQHPLDIEIEPHIDFLIRCVYQINGAVVLDELVELEKSAKTLNSLIDLAGNEGTPHILRLRNAKTQNFIATATDFSNASLTSISFESIPHVNIDHLNKTIRVGL